MRSRLARTFSTSRRDVLGLGPQPPYAIATLVPSAALPPRREDTKLISMDHTLRKAGEYLFRGYDGGKGEVWRRDRSS
jgi:hypothetical protein